MKYKKELTLGGIFLLLAAFLLLMFFTRNNKYSEYSYVKLSPLDYSTKYKEISLKDKNIDIYKIKTIEKSSKKILESKKWVEWEEHMEDKVFNDLEKTVLSIGDEEITMSYTNTHRWAYYIPKEDKNKIYLSYFLEYENLLYIVEIDNKEV